MRVFVESPYTGINAEEQTRNINYAIYAMRDCLKRGEAPFVPHLMYTQAPMVGFVPDNDPIHSCVGRTNAIDLSCAWRPVADRTVVYTDYGISRGMEYGIAHAKSIGQEIEYREINKKIEI